MTRSTNVSKYNASYTAPPSMSPFEQRPIPPTTPKTPPSPPCHIRPQLGVASHYHSPTTNHPTSRPRWNKPSTALTNTATLPPQPPSCYSQTGNTPPTCRETYTRPTHRKSRPYHTAQHTPPQTTPTNINSTSTLSRINSLSIPSIKRHSPHTQHRYLQTIRPRCDPTLPEYRHKSPELRRQQHRIHTRTRTQPPIPTVTTNTLHTTLHTRMGSYRLHLHGRLSC